VICSFLLHFNFCISQTAFSSKFTMGPLAIYISPCAEFPPGIGQVMEPVRIQKLIAQAVKRRSAREIADKDVTDPE
jgi:hypothetical protein